MKFYIISKNSFIREEHARTILIQRDGVSGRNSLNGIIWHTNCRPFECITKLKVKRVL